MTDLADELQGFDHAPEEILPPEWSQRPCPRCAAPVRVRDLVETTTLGDPEPTYLPVLDSCPTKGCGTTCVTCRRKPGEVHGPHCWDRMRDKLTDPHLVDRSDCLA